MTGLAALVLLSFAAFLAARLSTRRRRRGLEQGPLAPATPGGRAFAAHVGSLSDFRMELQLPRRR